MNKTKASFRWDFPASKYTPMTTEGSEPRRRTREPVRSIREYHRTSTFPLTPERGKSKCALFLTLFLWILWFPLARASVKCYQCYHTVYLTKGNSYLIKHSFRAHTYVNPSCYNITALSTCSESGKKYWIGRNIGNSKQKRNGECPDQENWLCFNFNYITKKEDLLKRRTYELDLIQEVVITEKENQKEDNPLVTDKNLFIDLAERISRNLNITNCWVCGGTLTSETWPWRGISIGPLELLKLNNPPSQTPRDQENWLLKDTVLGEECIWRKGKRYTEEVRETVCKRYLVIEDHKTWWIPREPDTFWSNKKIKNKNCILHPNEQLYQCWDPKSQPYSVLPQISKYWTSASNTHSHFWKAPQSLYWICGRKAYSTLPSHWRGSCTLGAIQPSFFLLSEEAENQLGVPLYDELRRQKRYSIGGTQQWGEEEWPPERILETYGPATWAQDGSWGYRTPIYMLNRIIRLQALIQIISNQTTTAIDLLNTQQSQTKTAVYQNRLALDYLLAEEGGVCGKFNTSDCCLHIDDHGEAITKITQNIRKLTHVPVQKWYPLTTSEWWKNMFSGEWWKKALIIFGISLVSLLFLPCLIPCFTRLIVSVVQSMPTIQNLQINQPSTQTAQKIMNLHQLKRKERKNIKVQQVYTKFKQLHTNKEELSTFT